MKKTILFTPMIALAMISSLSSCLDSDKNLYDSSFQTTNPMGEGFAAPDGFNWETLSNVQVTVNVNDQYKGLYYYKVEIYDANPIISTDAKLLQSGVAKKDEPLISQISINKAIKTLYIKEYTPTKLYTVRAAEIPADGIVDCNFAASPAPETRSAAMARGFVTIEDPNVDDLSLFPKECPANITEFKDESSSVANGIYKVTSATNKINLGQKLNITLYVTDNIVLKEELFLSPGSRLYVLPNQSITMPQSKNNGQQNCLISIGIGATFTVTNDMQLDSNYKFYNLGTLNAKSLSCTNSSVFYNAGTTHIEEKLSGENAGSTMVNAGTIKAEEISIQGNSHMLNRDSGIVEVEEETILNCTGGSWENDGSWTTDEMKISAWNDYCFNKCELIVKDELHLTEGHLIVDGNGHVQCSELYMNNSRVDLGAKSLFEVTEKAEYSYQTKDKGFKGTGNEKALLVIKKAVAEYPNNADMIHYSGNLQIVCSEHPNADLGWGKRWTLTNGAEWTEAGSNTVIIPKTCKGSGYGEEPSTPTTPTNPEFPIIMEDNQNYAYTFEDQWPLYGDYDMNDIVMVITKRKITTNNKNKVQRFELSIDLCAVGATRKLGAAIMFDKVPANAIKSPVVLNNTNLIQGFNLNQNIEKGQDLTVVPLFDDAHYALTGVNTNVPINTISDNSINTKQPKSINFAIEFSNPTLSADAFNVNSLNVFIFVGGNKEKRREIHIAGFQPTQFAEIDIFGGNNDNSSFANKKFYISKENLAWGIMVPTSFKWPLEYTNIKSAYSEFEKWVVSGGKEESQWWNNFHVEKVFQANKN